MRFSTKSLHANERILLATGPHWWLLVWPAVVCLVGIGGASAIFAIWSSAPSWFGWVLLAIALVGFVYFLIRLLQWRQTELVITSMRVVYRSGVLHRSGREIPVSSVQDVEYHQSLVERLLGKGRLLVESAGSHGEEPIRDVPHPAAVQSLINQSVDESRRRDVVEVEGGHASPSEELERLDGLRQRGVISESEFVRMKAELIERPQGEGD